MPMCRFRLCTEPARLTASWREQALARREARHPAPCWRCLRCREGRETCAVEILRYLVSACGNRRGAVPLRRGPASPFRAPGVVREGLAPPGAFLAMGT